MMRLSSALTTYDEHDNIHRKSPEGVSEGREQANGEDDGHGSSDQSVHESTICMGSCDVDMIDEVSQDPDNDGGGEDLAGTEHGGDSFVSGTTHSEGSHVSSGRGWRI